MRYFIAAALIATTVLISCHSSRKTAGVNVSLDTISISSNNPASIYRASSAKVWEIVDTRLELKFNLKDRTASGFETVTLHPYAYPTDSIWLDAKSMTIESVMIDEGELQGNVKKFEHKNDSLLIRLPRAYTRNEKLTLAIRYKSEPYKQSSGGSAAITDDRGLYFINHNYAVPGKPTQIWTQGETEANSHWFPTIDKPNQRSTFTMLLTVPDQFKTLSNGALISSKKNGVERTDEWRMDKPIQVYAAMFAIGDFIIVKDKPYKDKEIAYYVEPDYAPYAKLMFRNTPEMVSYFSDVTGVPYPWNKYSQVVVRDYVSGAMENTSASLFGEFLNQNKREIEDGNSEDVVSHELFHQWFGDYVTAESWSNLTLNESFATYGEQLWRRHFYGNVSADVLAFNDLNRYLNATEYSDPSLVRFYYRSREDMFDRVSYQKGASILRYLNTLIGDEAFNRAMNIYLTKNALHSAEATHWRMAVEEATGQDWSWFFNQWYYRAKHPVLNISYDYDDAAGQLTVTVKQDTTNTYRLPLKAALINGADYREFDWLISKKKEVFTYAYKNGQRPTFMPDASHVLVGEVREKKDAEQWLAQYKGCNEYVGKRRAIANVYNDLAKSTQAQQLFKLALEDTSWQIREYTLQRLEQFKDKTKFPLFKDKVIQMADVDDKNLVRAQALDVMNEWQIRDGESLDVVMSSLNDSSYAVAGAGLSTLYSIDSTKAFALARMFSNGAQRGRMLFATWEVIGKMGSDEEMTIFEKQVNTVSGAKKFYFTTSVTRLQSRVKANDVFENGLKSVKFIIVTESNKSYRETLTRILVRSGAELKKKGDAISMQRFILVKKYVQEIADKEEDEGTQKKINEMIKDSLM